MKIVKLTAENIKRLRAVEITPDGNTVVIAGRNGQGKTSVLDSIFYALGGGPAMKDTSRPIRDGETSASVSLDLGDLRVTRTWTGDKTALRVESADGARYGSPQQMLDRLLGRLSFDPLAFAGLPEREQLAALLDLVELPFDPAELDRKRKGLYDERTLVGRDGKQLTGQLAGMPEASSDLPATEASTSEVLAEYRRAQEDAQRQETEALRLLGAQSEVADLTRQIGEMQRLLAETEREHNRLSEVVASHTPVDLASFEQRLASVEETNRRIRLAADRAAVAERAEAAREQYVALGWQIAELDQRKAAAIRDSQMPIDGLAFDGEGVTYQGIPFKQCSSAEQLRVSLAMAMAVNPTIRVIRITDGSLLDSQNMALIEEMAADRDFQVWIERVDESGAVGVHIEDGAVVSDVRDLRAVGR